MTEPSEGLLRKVRALLAQAEDESVTPDEAQAFTAKAAELMAKYGIDRALLAATKPETDKPSNKIIDIDNPWGREKTHLLAGLAAAMRCQAILIAKANGVSRVHVFGYQSDIERLEVLYTSVLLQMSGGLRHAEVPEWTSSPRAWRRSWLLGYATAVIARVREAEKGAVQEAKKESTGAELVLADRSLVVRKQVQDTYPQTRKMKVTFTGSGYRQGYAKGERANIGGASVRNRTAGALRG